jgi:hypothetical protein
MSDSHSEYSSPQEESEAKLAAYIDGELDEAGRAEIERHLQANPNHRRLLEDVKLGRDLLRQLPREPAPAELMESFQSQLERAVLLDEEDEDASQEASSLRINPWYQFRAVAAVLLLAVMLGVVVFYSLPKPQDRGVALNNRTPTTGETFTDRAALPPPMGAPAEAAPTDPSGGLEAISPDAPARRLSKGGPGAFDGGARRAEKPAAPEFTDRTDQSKVGAAEAVVPEGMSEKVHDAAPLVSARGSSPELERLNFETMSNAVRNLASAEAVQVAIDRNTVSRSRAAKVGKGAAEADAYAEPLYVVVNTTDPAKAREEIHSYLGANGIRNVEVLDQTVAALQSPDRVAANVGREAGRQMTDLEARAREEKVRAKSDVGGARSPAVQLKKEQVGQVREPGAAPAPQGPAGGAGGTAVQQDAPIARGALKPSRPGQEAKAPAGQGYQNEANLQKRQDAPVTGLPEVLLQQGEAQQQSQQQQQVVIADDAQRIEGVLVARGMNRRQALAMQQNFNNPTQAQWAGVYEQPVELRRDARGGEQYRQGGARAGRAYDPTARGPAAAPSAPAAAPAASPPPAPGPAPIPPGNTGGAVRMPTADAITRGGAGGGGSGPGQPTTVPPAAQPSAKSERERLAGPLADGAMDQSRNPTSRPSAPSVVARRPAVASPQPSRPGTTQPLSAKVATAADKDASGRPMAPTGGADARQALRPAQVGQRDQKTGAEQSIAAQPTTAPSFAVSPNAAAATPLVAQAEETRAADEDLPLDVVIVLQRAPVSGGQFAEQSNAPAQVQAPANAAPATSPAAASRPAR